MLNGISGDRLDAQVPPSQTHSISDLAWDAATLHEQVLHAAGRIKPFIHRTPVLTSRVLNELSGAELFFKCENLQKTGSFKARGAHNAVFLLDDDAASRGVVTHSSGNHAAALALAAANRGITAQIVMPRNAPQAKIASTKRLGGQVTLCEPTSAAREAAANTLLQKTGGTLVHPFDNWNIIAGQGTAALELLDELPDLDVIVSPVGGGGLLSGTSLVACAHSQATGRACHVYGAEPQGADDAYRSFTTGIRQPMHEPRTIADGLRTALGERTFPIIRELATGIGTVSDDEILRATRLLWEVLKIVVEPSGAVPFAAVLESRVPTAGRRVGIILSGGNIDLDKLPWS